MYLVVVKAERQRHYNCLSAPGSGSKGTTVVNNDARESINRFSVPSLAGKDYFLTMRLRVVLAPCFVPPDESHCQQET